MSAPLTTISVIAFDQEGNVVQAWGGLEYRGSRAEGDWQKVND
jgi:hypothetical protein